MLYLIGLGLNERGISKEGLLALEKCKKIYLEGYTIDFPYNIGELKFGKKKNKIIRLSRQDVESDKLIREAKSIRVALLVYGSPLFATTHMSLILDAERAGVRTKTIYSSSVFDALAETGLQLYKFGKIASMPKQEVSFLQYVKENQSINAHSLILVDIGLRFQEAIDRLEKETEKENIKIDKIIVCSRLGTEESKILYDKIEDLKKQKEQIPAPFCFIIPAEMHFLEKEALERVEK
ncbi:MAG: diphthine synthase [Nanoarchaeota archaeon]|nr:diphthine synthase [Nanoarchaeota archaeon]